jgi:uncharacterized membrane protein YdbT with pleckstrin-like domain
MGGRHLILSGIFLSMTFSFHPFPIAGMVKALAATLVLLAAFFLIRDFLGGEWMPLSAVVGLAGLAVVFMRFLASRFRTISLDEKSVTYSSGIVSSRKITLPYSKITEASFDQNLVQRVFGVGTLNVDTAGGTPIAINVQDVRSGDYKTLMEKLNSHSGGGVP